jgi:hypothetical protein
LPALGADLSKKRLLTLGVQDCYFKYDQILAFLKKQGHSPAPLTQDQILPTTGVSWASPEFREGLIHQKTFFSLLGFSPENVQSMDASDYERPDYLHDLNVPIPESLGGQFDVVFDGGTIEHVFSLKDAFFNIVRLLNVGGIAVHHAPFDWPDHGFVNINPTLFRDFYLTNGFEELGLSFTVIHLKDDGNYRHIPVKEFKGVMRPEYGMLLFAAYHKMREQEIAIPTQGLYKTIWNRGKKS